MVGQRPGRCRDVRRAGDRDPGPGRRQPARRRAAGRPVRERHRPRDLGPARGCRPDPERHQQRRVRGSLPVRRAHRPRAAGVRPRRLGDGRRGWCRAAARTGGRRGRERRTVRRRAAWSPSWTTPSSSRSRTCCPSWTPWPGSAPLPGCSRPSWPSCWPATAAGLFAASGPGCSSRASLLAAGVLVARVSSATASRRTSTPRPRRRSPSSPDPSLRIAEVLAVLGAVVAVCAVTTPPSGLGLVTAGRTHLRGPCGTGSSGAVRRVLALLAGVRAPPRAAGRRLPFSPR